jgi:zinc/manganese transport system substrate-binding protein
MDPIRTMSRWVPLLLVAAATASACTSVGGNPPSSAGDRINVVAAENVYGDIVTQIGGHDVHVTSILTNPNADPHLFEPGTAAALAVARARLVIVNGLGYDAFMQRLLAAAPEPGRVLVTIANVLHAPPGANPHLWYDVPGLPAIAQAVAGGLIRAAPAKAPAFRANLGTFLLSLRPLDRAVTTLSHRFGGTGVAYTESVPGYLLQATHLANKAPDTFTKAIEDGIEPSPSATAQMEGLVTTHAVRLLLYNRQATSPITERVRQLAVANGVPVVGVTETLPPGQTFQQWQLGQVQSIAAALAGSSP